MQNKLIECRGAARSRPAVLLAVVGLASALIFSCISSDVRSENQRPNILFIAIDDLNDWAGFLGGHSGMKIHTPNLDRFAASSMIFSNAHTPAPACAPTRTAILTGVHHAISGTENVHWGDRPDWRQFEALKDIETLEQFFQNRGYKTLGAGKIYHSQAPPWTPTSQIEPANWDFYYPSAYISHPYQIRAPEKVRYPDRVDNSTRPGGKEKGWWTWGPIPVGDEKMADYHVVDWTRRQLQVKHDAPFFLASGVWKPHDPWEVPQKYFDMYPLDQIVLPPFQEDDLKDAFDHGRRWIQEWVITNKEWERVIQSYAAAITFADAMIGRLIDAFNDSPYVDNTIVVIWSDHGMHMGEKDNIEKFTLWERSTRVPLILSAPGVTQPGVVCQQPVSLMDIYPTLVDLAGFDPPLHVDGKSLKPLITNPTYETDPVVTSYKFDWAELPIEGHAVRSLEHRYIYYPEINLEEFYDLSSDPHEWHNIAYKKANGDLIQRHRDCLTKLIPNLTWSSRPPVGYSIDADGNILKDNFQSIY